MPSICLHPLPRCCHWASQRCWVNARNDLDVPVGSVLAYAARAQDAGDLVETLIFDQDALADDVPGHFSIITPSLGEDGGWPMQVQTMEHLMSAAQAATTCRNMRL